MCCCINDMNDHFIKISDSLCNVPCDGDESQTCGGQAIYLVNVFNSNPYGNKYRY